MKTDDKGRKWCPECHAAVAMYGMDGITIPSGDGGLNVTERHARLVQANILHGHKVEQPHYADAILSDWISNRLMSATSQ